MKGIIKKPSKKGERFTQIADCFAENPNLKGRAKWVFWYLWSKPEGWLVRPTDIAKHCTDGVNAIKTDIVELQETGHLKYERERLASGRWGGTSWFLSEEPVKEWIVHYSSKKPQSNIGTMDLTAKKPQSEKPESGKPSCISNKEFSNKEEKAESAKNSINNQSGDNLSSFHSRLNTPELRGTWDSLVAKTTKACTWE